MTLPTMPSTHTWVQGGPMLAKAGRAALYGADGAAVWVWNEQTNLQITNLLDANSNPITTVPIVDGWIDGVGVPVATQLASFSVGQFGKRFPALPVATITGALSAGVANDSAVATLLGDPASATRVAGDAVYAPTGASGLGIQVADGASTATLNAALTSAATFGAVVHVGNHTLSASVSVPSGATLRGRNNDSRLVLPAGATYPAIDIDGQTDVKVERLRVTRAAATAANACAVRVRGASNRVDLIDVRAESLNSGFRIVGGEGSTPGVCTRVTMTRCRATSSDVYGFWIDDVDGLELAHCTSNVSGLDGVKLRKKTKNVTITGGWFTGATGGDGMDAYAGGESFTIQGASFSGNTINGLTIKCDDLNKSDPTNYGLPRNITLTGLRCDNNGGNGLGIHRNGSTDDATEPLVARVTVAGGTFNGNTGHGLFIRSRQISLLGVLAANNQGNGIRVEPTAFDIAIMAPQCAGNGRRDAVTDGISVAGQRVQIFGGTSIGSDPDGATSDADLSAGTKYQRYGLRLEATATGAVVVGLTLKYNVTAPLSNSTTDALVINGTGSDAAESMYLPNNRKIQAYKAGGTLTDLLNLTAADALNIGKADATSTNLFGAVINTFARLQTQASTTTTAGLRVPPGTAPTSPANGDIWTDASGMYVRINGVTKTVTLT